MSVNSLIQVQRRALGGVPSRYDHIKLWEKGHRPGLAYVHSTWPHSHKPHPDENSTIGCVNVESREISRDSVFGAR